MVSLGLLALALPRFGRLDQQHYLLQTGLEVLGQQTGNSYTHFTTTRMNDFMTFRGTIIIHVFFLDSLLNSISEIPNMKPSHSWLFLTPVPIYEATSQVSTL